MIRQAYAKLCKAQRILEESRNKALLAKFPEEIIIADIAFVKASKNLRKIQERYEILANQ